MMIRLLTRIALIVLLATMGRTTLADALVADLSEHLVKIDLGFTPRC